MLIKQAAAAPEQRRARRALAPKPSPRPAEIVRDAVIVHGGSGIKGRPWIPTLEEIGGKEFVAVDRSNREVAKYLGYDMCSGNPMQGASWVLQLMGLRDAEVTAIIDKNKPKASAINSRMGCACASLARDRSCWGGAREHCSR